MMRIDKRRTLPLLISFLIFAISSPRTWGQDSLQIEDAPQGGKIVFGPIEGARTQAAAMSEVLRTVHKNCGEKPQVGKVFKLRGTTSDAVFFTVVNHNLGNSLRAGLLISAAASPKDVEVGAVMDDASRFGATVNPMLNQLFGEWHPGSGSGPARGGPAPPRPMRQVVAQDRSASANVPEGWNFKANGGTAIVTEPHYNVIIDINLVRLASNPSYNQRFGGAGMGGRIIYPSNVDLVRGFPGLIKEFYRVNNTRFDFQIASVEPMAAPQGQRCAHASGRGLLSSLNAAPPNVAQKDYPEIDALLCTTAPGPLGNYMVSLSLSEIMAGHGDMERATVGAILSSYQVNQAVVAGEANAMAAPAIAAIHQIGAAATARYNATQQANDAQHAGYWAQQDVNARQGQAFNNYLLDQTVLQDNNMYGNGTIGHGTVWNSTADALVKANPNRYEIVNTPNFWQGVDY
jgi:hypothetical protein